MAAKELETTTVERRRARTSCGHRPRRRCSTASPASTEGRDDGADDERSGPAGHRRGRHDDDRGRHADQHFTEPPPRYTEATLIKALEERGIGRPSTYAATISTILDRGYVRVDERRLRPERSARSLRTCSSSTSATMSTRSSPPAWRKLDEIARATASGSRSCATSTAPSRAASIRSGARSSQRHQDPAEQRGLLTGPSDGREARPNRWFLACSTPSTRSRGRSPARRPRRRPGRVSRARSAARAARRQDRPVRPVRRLLPVPRLQLHQEGGPAPPEPLPFEVVCPRTATATSSPVAPGVPATSSGAAPRIPSATTRRTSSRSARSTTPTRDPVARKGESGICLKCGADIPLPDDDDLVGARLAGGPPSPEALQRPARSGGSRRGGNRGGSGAADGRGDPGRDRRAGRDRPRARRTRERGGRVPPRAGAVPARPRRPRCLAQHPPLIRDRGRGLPGVAGRPRGRLATPVADRPPRVPRPPRRRRRSSTAQRLAAIRRSIATPHATSLPATRGARSRRRACGACRASSRSSRWRRSSRSSTRSWLRRR